MLEHDFSKSQYDNCVYFMMLSNGSLVFLLINVDDMLIDAKNMSKIKLLEHMHYLLIHGQYILEELHGPKIQ